MHHLGLLLCFVASQVAAQTPASPPSSAAFLYQLPIGALGDVIPFYSDGKFHLFHLAVGNIPGRKGMDWNQIITPDFVSYERAGVGILRGESEDSVDLDMWTGSVFYKDGMFYAFYTGHNTDLFLKQGKADQVILRAVSRDGILWTKEPGFLFSPEGHASYHYQPNKWRNYSGACRDPFIFWNPEAKEYGMLFTSSPDGYGGVGYAGSADLEQWRIDEPFAASKHFRNYECPDIFQMGERWYLVFSTGDENPGWGTRYMSAPSLQGPWTSPADDFFDGGSLYAAKTVSDGKRRFLCGTLTARKGKRDDGENSWGGRLLIYEIQETAEGKLRARIPAEVEDSFGNPLPIAFKNLPKGVLEERGEGLWFLRAGMRHELGKLPSRCLLSMKIKVPESGRAGVWVGGGGKEGFRLFVDAGTQRIVWDRGSLPLGANPEKERPWRPLKIQPGDWITVKVALDGDAAVACINDSVCLSTRIYDRRENKFGIWSDAAGPEFANIMLRSPSTSQPQ